MKYSLFLFVLLGLIFSGCAKSYDVESSYDKDTKTAKIDNYIIEDVSFYDEKNSGYNIDSKGNTEYIIKTIRSDGGICDYINIKNYQSRGSWFYYKSAKEDVLKRYGNNCDVEEVGNNLVLLKCYSKYYMTSSSVKNNGYGSKITIDMDKNCFQDMSKHFKAMAKPSNIVKIKERKVILIYSGTFASTKASKCASDGKIAVYINNEIVGGNISYKLKNKDYMSDIKGNIIGKKFTGKTENLQFIGTLERDSIEGKYYSDKCEGVFNAKLEK